MVEESMKVRKECEECGEEREVGERGNGEN
jgi:uncharacterized protein (DUF983 family)